jgi:hypothetical protein
VNRLFGECISDSLSDNNNLLRCSRNGSKLLPVCSSDLKIRLFPLELPLLVHSVPAEGRYSDFYLMETHMKN